jgi:hypothetical protein
MLASPVGACPENETMHQAAGLVQWSWRGRPVLLPALSGRGWGWVEQNRASLGVVSRPTI